MYFNNYVYTRIKFELKNLEFEKHNTVACITLKVVEKKKLSLLLMLERLTINMRNTYQDSKYFFCLPVSGLISESRKGKKQIILLLLHS